MERFRKSAPAAVAFALLLASANITSTLAQSSSGSSVTVTGTGGSGLNFRSTPGGAIVKTFPDGTRMRLVGDNQQAAGRSWRNVQSPDGVVGWMAAEYLSGTANAPESSTTQAAYQPAGVAGSTLQIVKTGGMNAILRDNPGGTQIGSYPEGSNLTLVAAAAREAGGREWKNVRGPDGKTGWMASFLLSGESSATVANNNGLLASRSPFTLTADMRARTLAARARAVPLSATGNSTTTDNSKSADKKTDSKPTSTARPADSKPTSTSTPTSSSSVKKP